MKLKSKYNKKLKVLQLDGGGAKGVMFLAFLSRLEKALGKPCHKIFDLVIGTSTGGITAALIASGMPASKILDMYLKELKKIFKKRFLGLFNPATWFTGSRYKRGYADALMLKYLHFPMNKAKIKLVVTGINMKDSKLTHFFKSYKKKYKDIITAFPVMATYSAPTYFGYFEDKKDVLKSGDKEGGIWTDGGCGTQSCTLMQAYIETRRLKAGSNYFILSCGCGYTNLGTEERQGFIRQIKNFLPIAREQAIWEQVNDAEELGLNVFRVDGRIPNKLMDLDKVKNKYLQTYKIIGEQWANSFLPELLI